MVRKTYRMKMFKCLQVRGCARRHLNGDGKVTAGKALVSSTACISKDVEGLRRWTMRTAMDIFLTANATIEMWEGCSRWTSHRLYNIESNSIKI